MTTSTNIHSNIPEQSQLSPARSTDQLALWAGILFSVVFSALIWSLGGRLQIDFLPDSGASWYYWRLPVETMGAKVTAWGFYLIHQLLIWWLIDKAQNPTQPAKSRYTAGLHWFNWAALGVNALFAFVHLIQTHVWYDALAQDVSIWSSQWSVILMLVLIVLLENSRRGLFFGYKVPMSQRVTSFIRQYHGFIFSWGIIYTFWYHPMEATTGHLIGFFYTFLLMLQGSLMFTRAHLNRWWTLSMEVLVMFHGVLVALNQSGNMWPMFGFGFAGVFVLTQMHGLGLSRWVRGALLGLYVIAALAVYSINGIGKIYQITFIPVTYYLALFILAGLIGGVAWLYAKFSQSGATQPAS